MNATTNVWAEVNERTIPVSHQGDSSGGASPCSEGAFDLATQRGFRFFETDVRVTADGTLVAVHDVAARVKGKKFSTLPREVIEKTRGFALLDVDTLAARYPDAAWNLEVKSQADADALVEQLTRTPELCRHVLVSWGPTFGVARRTRARLRAIDPTIANSASLTELFGLFVRANLGLSVPTQRFECAQFLHLMVTRRLVRSLNTAGIAVHAWGNPSRRKVQRLADFGVDAIFTDATGPVSELLDDGHK